jgi:hypothetical protein
MKVRYLVRWNPYHVVRVLHDGETCEVPEGFDIISQPLSFSEQFIEKWQGDIDWEKVLELHEKGKYFDIFVMHNQGEWTDDNYCCETYYKNVDYNVGLYKNSRKQKN